MSIKLFTSVVILFNVVLIRCDIIDLFEGDLCDLHDGSKGICTYIERCRLLRQGFKYNRIPIKDITTCSFKGSKQYVCCGDTRPVDNSTATRPLNLPSDFVFPSDLRKIWSLPPESNDAKERRGGDTSVRKAILACQNYTQLPQVQPLDKVTGGLPTYVGEFPHMAALAYVDAITNETKFGCGGTIISENFILTAAHCTLDKNLPKFVRLGKVTLLTDEDEEIAVDIKIQEVIKHPEYSYLGKKNDLALLRLETPIPLSDRMKPACLRTDLEDLPVGVDLFVTGWGSTSGEQTLIPEYMMKTNVTTMELSRCNASLLEYNKDANERSLRNGIAMSQYCASDIHTRHDACQGDSGGPLQLHNTIISLLVAVVSFGISCGTELPSIYTRVAYYLDWIEPIVWPDL